MSDGTRIIVRGAVIGILHENADEFEVMRAMICSLPEWATNEIEVMWSNRQRGTYTVYIREWDEDLACRIGDALHDAAMASQRGGHGGIRIEANGTDRYIEIDGAWSSQ